MTARTDPVSHQGRITASVTHEFKNVLAIIGETAGLMEDLLDALDESPMQKRILEKLDAIGKQVARGQRLSTCLNRFAHLPDERPCRFDCAEFTAQLVALSERPARLAEIQLLLGDCDSRTISADPVILHMALFQILEHVWKALAPEDSMTLRCTVDGECVAWSIAPNAKDKIDEQEAISMASISAALQRTIRSAGLELHEEKNELLLSMHEADGAQQKGA